MSDEVESKRLPDWLLATFFVLFAMGLLVLGLSFVEWQNRDVKEKKNRLMRECMADGKKEYECLGLIRKAME